MTDPAQRLREIAAWVDRINPYVEEIQLYPNYEGPVDLRLIADQFEALKDRVREAERNAPVQSPRLCFHPSFETTPQYRWHDEMQAEINKIIKE